jgi:hypothetical protein
MGAVEWRGRDGVYRDLSGMASARPALKKLTDCRICGAPNGEDREGCWNCGGLLRLGPDPSDMIRLAVGEAERPGRVRYVRAWGRLSS